MAAPVYSTRFLIAHSAALWVTYQVPPAHRAVLSSIVLTNELDTATDYATIEFALYRFMLRYPVKNSTETYEVRQVLYAGETLRGLVSRGGLYLFLSGYLFREDALRRAGAPDVEEEPATPEDGLPEVPAPWAAVSS